MSELVIRHGHSSNRYNVSITAIDSKKFGCKIAIKINQLYTIALPKTQQAKLTFKTWYDKDFMADNMVIAESLDRMKEIISNKKHFDIIDEQREAYLEAIEIDHKFHYSVNPSATPPIYPARPDESFDLLKDWYFEMLEIEKGQYLKTSIDANVSALNTFEIEFIERQMEMISRTYLTPRSEGAKRFFAASSNTNATIANKTFLQWLAERKKELEENKVYSIEEEKARRINGVKTWDKKTRAYLLKELGFYDLPILKKMSQNKRDILLAHILQAGIDTAKDYSYGKIQKIVNPDKAKEVKSLIAELKKGV